MALNEAAAAQPAEPRVTLAFVSLSPGDALDRLAAAAGVSVVADARVLAAAADRRVSCRGEAVAAESLLRCIVREAGLDFYRLSSGTYVITGGSRVATRPGALAGVVVDAVSGDPVPQARLTLAERREARAAGLEGAFGFGGLAPGRYRLLATAVGYAPAATEVDVAADGTVRTRVALRPLPVVVAPVVVNGIAPLPGAGRVGGDTVGDADLSRLALYGGGLMTAAPGLVGVAQRSGLGELHVQGGASGEQLMRIDGAPVFDPVSLGRAFGGVAPQAVGRLTVHKAGFSAATGSATGSVIDLTHALADDDAPLAAVTQVDPYSAAARVTGATRVGATPLAVMAAARGSVWGLWRAPALDRAIRAWNAPDPVLAERLFGAGTMLGGATGPSALGATDLHLAVRARPGAFRTVHASVYHGAHSVGSEWLGAMAAGAGGGGVALPVATRDRYAWRSTAAQARVEGLAGAGLAYTLRVRASAHDLTHRYGMTMPAAAVIAPHEGNAVTELAAEATAARAFGAAWETAGGVELARTSSALDMQGPLMRPITARVAVARATGWAEARRRLGAGVAVEAGVRVTALEGAAGRALAEPRVAVRGDGAAAGLGRFAWRAAAGGYRQFVPEFDVATFGPSALVPNVRFWLPASAATGVPRAVHLAAEGAAEPRPGWSVRAEAYWRRQPELLAVDYGALAAGAGDSAARDPRAFVGRARGAAYGAGARLARARGRARVEVGYDYSQALRTFPSRFDGLVQPAPWNEPHRALLAADLLPAAGAGAAAGGVSARSVARPVARPAGARLPGAPAGFGGAFGATLRVRGTWGRTWALRQAYYDLLSVHGAGAGLPVGLPGDAGRPALYEVDAGVSWTRRVGGVRLEVAASVLDVFGRRNVLDFALAPGAGGGFVRVPRPVLGAQPVVAVRAGW